MGEEMRWDEKLYLNSFALAHKNFHIPAKLLHSLANRLNFQRNFVYSSKTQMSESKLTMEMQNFCERTQKW